MFSLDEDIERGTSMRRSAPGGDSGPEDSMQAKFKSMHLSTGSSRKPSGSSSRPTSKPVAIRSSSRELFAFEKKVDALLMSQSMPVRPPFGSLPAPVVADAMPDLALPPTPLQPSYMDFDADEGGAMLGDMSGDDIAGGDGGFAPRSLIHQDYATSCPAAMACFPADVVEQMALPDVGLAGEEVLLGSSVTAFSLLGDMRSGRSPAGSVEIDDPLARSSTRATSFDEDLPFAFER